MEDNIIEELELTTIAKYLDDYIAEFKELYARHLEADGRVATRQLIDNFTLEVNVMGTTINVMLNVADYYRYVENGRSSGRFPPVDKIIKWIEAKPIIPRPDAKGKLPTTNQLAFLIGRKIANQGYEGKPSLITTVDELNAKYIPLFQQALEEDFGLYQIKVLDEINKMIKI